MMLVLFLIFGLLMGSFLNVLISRIPRGESIVLPPSHCITCAHRLSGWDLIPVFSFLLLGGRCRYCRSKISWQYPCIETVTAALTVLCWNQFGWSLECMVMLLLVYGLIVIALIDFFHQIIPNVLTIPLIVLGFLFQWWQGDLLQALLGGIIGGGILWLIVLIYPKGMGMGDVKYLAMVGVFVGWLKAIFILFLGSFLGVVVIVPLVLLGWLDRKQPFAFGPFLVIGTILVIFLPKLITLVLPSF